MARIKYYYDTEKCRYERVQVKPRDVLISILGFLSLAFLFALGLTFSYYQFFPSPEEIRLRDENNELRHDFGLMEKEMNSLSEFASILEKQDKEAYRTVYEIERPETIFKRIEHKDYLSQVATISSCKKFIGTKLHKLDSLKQRLHTQNQSYTELLAVVKNKKQYFSNLPAFFPVAKSQGRLASGFGYRRHPIYRDRRFHKGIDFAAPRGTPIYATGNGKIKTIKSKRVGYGNQVVIDHGFGFQTRYAHMKKILVKPGQEIQRGEQIGTVGNTGASTGPHVHYEVIKNNKVVNPIYYFFNDLSEEEYQEILSKAKLENKSLS